MVCTDRQRRGVPARAVRRFIPLSLARFLTLGGLIAAGWLLAGVGTALADDAFPMETRAQRSSMAEDSQRLATDTVGISRVGGVLDAVSRDVAELIAQPPAAVAEKVGTRADQLISPEEGVFKKHVPDAITRPAEEVAGDLNAVVAVIPEVDVLTFPSTAPDVGERSAPPAEVGNPEPEAVPNSEDEAARAEHVPDAAPKHGDDAPGGAGVAGRPTAGTAQFANGSVPFEQPAAPSKRPWQPGADSVGAVSSSPAPIPVAGYLTHRAEALRLVAQYSVLPEGPVLVARETADAPSFSPD